MLPKLRVMLAALLATSLVALAASAGLIGSGNPGKPVSDVPAVSRPLVQRAIIEMPERRHLRVLAYSRRADELARLRDLPASPVRAVVEYAEHAQKATGGAPPPAETACASARAEPAVLANAQPPAPATTDAIRTAIPPAAHPDAPPRAAAAEPTPPAAGETHVAVIETAPEANEAAIASDQQKPKRRHGLHASKPHPRTARLTPVPLPRRIPPQAETGFPIDAPKAPAETWTPAATAATRAAAAPVPNRAAQAPTPFQGLSNDTTLDTRVEGGR